MHGRADGPRQWDLRANASCAPSSKKSCCEQNLQGCPGCTDSRVESCVCQADARCCARTWDSLCVYRASTSCMANCSLHCTNPCNQVSTCPGCTDATQRACVCDKIKECCLIAWTERCVTVLVDSCGGTPPTPSVSPSYIPPSSSPSNSPSAPPSPSVSPSYVPPSVSPSSVPSSASPSLSSTPLAGNHTDGDSSKPSLVWGMVVFLSVMGCLSVSTCGAVALYYYRKKKRVEELGVSSDKQPYSHLEDDLFDGAEEDDEDLPDPFAEEFASQEMEMRERPPSDSEAKQKDGQPSVTPARSTDNGHSSAGNGHVAGDAGHSELVVATGSADYDDDDDNDEESVDMFAERS